MAAGADGVAVISDLFMADEVEAAWTWVDQIHAAWKRIGMRPKNYSSGGWGPSESIALVARDSRSWYEAD